MLHATKRASPPQNLVGWTACLEFIYTNTHSIATIVERAGSYCAAGKLWQRDTVGWLAHQDSCNRWLQALQEVQARKGRWWGSPVWLGAWIDWSFLMAMTKVSVYGFISKWQQGRYLGGSLLQSTQPGQRAGWNSIIILDQGEISWSLPLLSWRPST